MANPIEELGVDTLDLGEHFLIVETHIAGKPQFFPRNNAAAHPNHVFDFTILAENVTGEIGKPLGITNRHWRQINHGRGHGRIAARQALLVLNARACASRLNHSSGMYKPQIDREAAAPIESALRRDQLDRHENVPD